MSPTWAKSKWKAEELNEKTIHCAFRDSNGTWETIGKLVVEKKPGSPDEIAVEIWIQEVTPDNQLMLNRIALPPQHVERIEKAQKGESDFELPGELNLVPDKE